MMFQYRAFGVSIDSELELRDLPSRQCGEGEVAIRMGSVPHLGAPRGNLREQYVYVKTAGRFYVTSQEIVVDPGEGQDEHATRVVLLGRAMACLLRLRGWLPLHASGIEMEGRGVVFLGVSGSGKSTMAAAAYARGHTVITDDVAAVRLVGGQCRVLSAGSRLRLSEDAMTLLDGLEFRGEYQMDKHTVGLQRRELSEQLPLHRIYVLEYGDQLSASVLPRLVSIPALSIHSFVRRRWLEVEALRVHVQDCAAVSEVIPVHRLIRPRNLTNIIDVVRFIETDLSIC